MHLTILGSGTLIPVPKRGNSGYFLKMDEHKILLDGGSGTLRRMADFGVNHREIDTICYTHMHPDHTFDLIPLLFSYRHDFTVEMPRTLRIIAPRGFHSYYDKLMEIYEQWVLPEGLKVTIQEVFRDTVKLGNLTIECNHTEHLDHSVTYRFKTGGSELLYSGDTDYCQELIESARDVDVLLLECALPDSMEIEGHMTPSKCGRLAAAANCKRLILTHFYPPVLDTNILSTVSKFYNGPVELAYDGMEVEV